jgi:hypothetical protein
MSARHASFMSTQRSREITGLGASRKRRGGNGDEGLRAVWDGFVLHRGSKGLEVVAKRKPKPQHATPLRAALLFLLVSPSSVLVAALQLAQAKRQVELASTGQKNFSAPRRSTEQETNTMEGAEEEPPD